MKVLIVEDETIIAERMERLLGELVKEVPLEIHRIEYLDEAVSYLGDQKVDLVFLDINLNGENGFELLEHLAAGSFQTVIVSAYHDRALTAFEYGVLDFIPKPFNKQRVEKTLDRFFRHQPLPAASTRFLVVQKRGRLLRVPLEEIVYIMGAGNYSELILQNGSKEIHSKSLNSLLQILPDYYERVHKSYIVDIRSAKGIKIISGGRYRLLLESDFEIPVGRSRYEMVRKKLMESL